MALIEVEYLKGGKRRKMKKVYSDVLTKMGIVKVVNDPPSQIGAPRIRTASLDAKGAQTQEGEEPKRKRAYKRRDMQAEGIVDKTV